MKKVIATIVLIMSIVLFGCIPDPPNLDEPGTPPEPEFSMYYHHVNNKSFGTALIDCADTPKWDACMMGDYQMLYHGVDDCDGNCDPRHLYVVYNKQGLTGVITCVRGQEMRAIMVPEDTNGMLWGECSGRM